jgi:CheY-like chemotaxis protein
MNQSGQMKNGLRILHLEDDLMDFELIAAEFRHRNIPCLVTRVFTEKEFETKLEKGGMDLILSDSHLPCFDTLSALTLARRTHPDVPFIFVSGAISPTIKADAFRLGATDFISKDDLVRLSRVVNWLFFPHKRKRRVPPLPEMGMPVMVQCKEFRCLGYLDRKGLWRDYEKSTELPDVIDWFDL